MPITLLPFSRRRFLAGATAAGIGLLLPPELRSEETPRDPHRLALLSDVHIDADPLRAERGVVMHDHLKQVCDEVARLEPRPASVFINGDCAYHTGELGDYKTLLKLLEPVRERGMPLHLGMGNHDSREHLWKTIPDAEAHVEPLPDRQILVAEYPRANVFMLDSLQTTNHTPGLLGEKQIHWLTEALDQRPGKPAIVMVHHQPDERAKVSGLTDTKPLLDALIPRRHVKALFYGHTHVWEKTVRQGLHCINLPAVAYVFKPGEPSGWVDARLHDTGMSLELCCIDPAHPKHGEKVDLTWRAG